VTAGNQNPRSSSGVFSLFNTRDAPRSMPISTGCAPEMLGVPGHRVFETLQVYLGSAYVNDFNLILGRGPTGLQAQARCGVPRDEIP